MDKCGPSGEHWFFKTISALVPDKPFGVDISDICGCHDQSWRHEPNKSGDVKLRNAIKARFEEQSKPKYQAWITSWGYFTGVTVFRGITKAGFWIYEHTR